MTLQIDDWSPHMMQTELQLKAMEHDLMNKKYDEITMRVMWIKKHLDCTVAWVAKQGSSKGVDVVQILEGNLPAHFEPTKSLLISAIQEIEQLRAERKFWLKSGFEIGKNDQGS
jgi:hypothetical protein